MDCAPFVDSSHQLVWKGSKAMALGKLWNALFGRREAPENQLAAAGAANSQSTAAGTRSAQSRRMAAGDDSVTSADAATAPQCGADRPKRAAAKRSEKSVATPK